MSDQLTGRYSSELAQRSIECNDSGNLIYPLINSNCPTCDRKLDGILYAYKDHNGDMIKTEIQGMEGLVLSPCQHRLPHGWGIVFYRFGQTAYIQRLPSSFHHEVPVESEGGEIIEGTLVDDNTPVYLEIENHE